MSSYRLTLVRQVEESSLAFSKRAIQLITSLVTSLAVEGESIHKIRIVAESASGVEIDCDLK